MESKKLDYSAPLTKSGEIATLVSGSSSIQAFLDRCVDMVSRELVAEVCSLYLLEADGKTLILRANKGLAPEVVGNFRLPVDHGLTGRVIRELAPLMTADAPSHPDYHPAPGSGEEDFPVFLGVPVRRGAEKVGVLSVQRRRGNDFTGEEVKNLATLAGELAAVMENARFFLSLAPEAMADTAKVAPYGPAVTMTRGQTVSPGCAMGGAQVFKRIAADRILELSRLHDDGMPGLEPFEQSIADTSRQLDEAQKNLGRRLPEAASLIFESHLMMLKDNGFVGRIRERIENGNPTGRAVAGVAAEYIKIFEKSDHDYLREKARDVEDLALRLLDNLSPAAGGEHLETEDHIVIAHELLPSDILRIAQSNAKGIVLVSGGSTAHVSLLVRSLGIPMIIAGDLDLQRVREGDQVIVDGYSGAVYVNPTAQAVESYRQRQRIAESARINGAGMRERTETRDGHRVCLMANINLLSELGLARSLKAEGIGLYRTEFPYLVRPDLPSEADQLNVYRRLLKEMGDLPVTFRTLDAGGDKVLSYFDSSGEANPALGLRSTRFSLKFVEVFDQQLRAILLAARGRKNVRLMFPMIGSLDELRQARQRFNACAEAVFGPDMKAADLPGVGMMVELPAVVELADDFAAESDFLSIGTNDFIQYMLAVDRTNERVSEFYRPHHPSVLRGLKRIVDAARRNHTEVSVCGEMAHDVRYVPFFVGIGVRHLSVEPNHLPGVQDVIARFTVAEAEAYAERLLAQTVVSEVEQLLDGPGQTG